MSYDEYLNEWNGQQVTAYSGECVALVAQYEAESNLPIVWGNAVDWINHPVMLTAYDWVDNNPADPNQLPGRGNIIIWNGQLPGSGGYGHIALFDSVLAVGAFQSFDQNWHGAEAHFQAHTWGYVAGWYTPKPPEAIPQPVSTPDPHTENTPPPEPVVVPPPYVAPPPEPTPTPLPTGALNITSPLYDKVIVKQIPGYETMTDAQNRTNPTDVVSPGITYYLRTSQGGMDKLATDASGANAVWINPALNVPDPTPEAAAKTSLSDIQKQWPVTVTTASPATVDNTWKATMVSFLGTGGARKPLRYKLNRNYDMHDIAEYKGSVAHLKQGQKIMIKGTFTGPDGIKYYRPLVDSDSMSYWGIRVMDSHGNPIISSALLEAQVLVDEAAYYVTPIKKFATEALAEGEVLYKKAERLFPVFDIFKKKKQ